MTNIEIKQTIKSYEDYVNSGLYNDDQLSQISFGFENGLTPDQIDIYAKPAFAWYKMHEILWGFKDGLTLDQVMTYADPKLNLDWGQMCEKRHALSLTKDEQIDKVLKH